MYAIYILIPIIIIIAFFLLFSIGPSPYKIKRRFPRHLLKGLSLPIKILAEDQTKDANVKLKKISQVGINFISDIDIPENSIIKIYFSEKYIKAQIRFKGVIEKTPKRVFEYGAEYIEADQETCRLFLNSILKKA